MGDFFFKPKVVTVHVGQAVRFVNVGKIEHTVADMDANGNIRSRLSRWRPLARGAYRWSASRSADGSRTSARFTRP
jgi:plastocyanin